MIEKELKLKDFKAHGDRVGFNINTDSDPKIVMFFSDYIKKKCTDFIELEFWPSKEHELVKSTIPKSVLNEIENKYRIDLKRCPRIEHLYKIGENPPENYYAQVLKEFGEFYLQQHQKEFYRSPPLLSSSDLKVNGYLRPLNVALEISKKIKDEYPKLLEYSIQEIRYKIEGTIWDTERSDPRLMQKIVPRDTEGEIWQEHAGVRMVLAEKVKIELVQTYSSERANKKEMPTRILEIKMDDLPSSAFKSSELFILARLNEDIYKKSVNKIFKNPQSSKFMLENAFLDNFQDVAKVHAKYVLFKDWLESDQVIKNDDNIFTLFGVNDFSRALDLIQKASDYQADISKLRKIAVRDSGGMLTSSNSNREKITESTQHDTALKALSLIKQYSPFQSYTLDSENYIIKLYSKK